MLLESRTESRHTHSSSRGSRKPAERYFSCTEKSKTAEGLCLIQKRGGVLNSRPVHQKRSRRLGVKTPLGTCPNHHDQTRLPPHVARQRNCARQICDLLKRRCMIIVYCMGQGTHTALQCVCSLGTAPDTGPLPQDWLAGRGAPRGT